MRTDKQILKLMQFAELKPDRNFLYASHAMHDVVARPISYCYGGWRVSCLAYKTCLVCFDDLVVMARVPHPIPSRTRT